MKDVTGKSGTGKRILDENGVWISVSALPQEVQDEIKKNSKIADEDRRHRAMGTDRDVHGHKANSRSDELIEENAELRALIKEQGDLLESIRSGIKNSKEEEVEVIIAPKKQTKKQKLQAKAEELGLDYEEEDTIPSLEKNIKEANSY